MEGARFMIPRLILASSLLAVSAGALRADEPKEFTVKRTGDCFDILLGDELVARSHFGKDVAKPYFWPLNAPGGIPVTRAWPMEKGKPGESTDHPHQKSMWFCHGDVIPEEIELKQRVKGIEGVDFWSEEEGHGTIMTQGSGEGQTTGEIGEGGKRRSYRNMHLANIWRSVDGADVLGEITQIELHDLGTARLFIFKIELTARFCPILFGDTKEGSFGVRVNDAIREEKGNGKITNADGKSGEKQCWGRVSAWCDYSGTIDGKSAGIAIFADPKNPYPSCWHVRGYGLMAANPFGRDKSGFPAMKGKTDLVKLAKGEHLKLRYGLLLHLGDVKDGKVAERYEQFVTMK
jgi:hypothetical protein